MERGKKRLRDSDAEENDPTDAPVIINQGQPVSIAKRARVQPKSVRKLPMMVEWLTVFAVLMITPNNDD
ncbi:hypothetical protein D915_010931 [Fasciola hepatica]|uniref:Uncharacterized protein n=1 Tax=Fasciola hepatica TaxID=6192 RepID=A0A4E0QXQ9_FASHE|nr:hypothetical protein D915_010931 [Fasciola hepatica]